MSKFLMIVGGKPIFPKENNIGHFLVNNQMDVFCVVNTVLNHGTLSFRHNVSQIL